jgi:uncharacterized membrane protein
VIINNLFETPILLLIAVHHFSINFKHQFTWELQWVFILSTRYHDVKKINNHNSAVKVQTEYSSHNINTYGVNGSVFVLHIVHEKLNANS